MASSLASLRVRLGSVAYLTNGDAEIVVRANTVSGVLGILKSRYPRLGEAAFDGDGSLAYGFFVTRNGEIVRDGSTLLDDDDTLSLYCTAGGCCAGASVPRLK